MATGPPAFRTAMALATMVLAHLAPAPSSAEDIRVLLLVPRDLPEVAAHVARLERAISESESSLVVVTELAAADVIVEFTGYRRGTTERSEPAASWYGHHLVVTSATEAAGAAVNEPQPFALLATGPEDDLVTHAVTALEMVLAKALGREAEGPTIEST